MGMFDDIRFEVPIPGDPKPNDRSFQTKDFECLLDCYLVRADGTLWRQQWNPDAESWADEDQCHFHGLLNFYTLEDIEDSGSPGKRDGIWFEYEAKFTDGVLQGIEVVDIHRANFGKPATPIYKRPAKRTGAGHD